MNKKRFIIVGIFLVILIILGLVGFVFRSKDGDVSQVKIVIDEESTFSKNDIDKAKLVIFEEFKKYPASMERLVFEEKRYEYMANDYKEKYNASDVIVFYSDFMTYSRVKKDYINFEPNRRYSDWVWILTRNEGDNWVLRECGY